MGNDVPGSVLVVEDEPEVREFICVALRAKGWETIEAATGAEALAALAGPPVAVVTLDINLPGESGYEVCRQIRAISDVPVVFLTARTDEFDQVLGLELGADDFLTKPVSPRILQARVALAARRGVRPAHAAEGELNAGALRLDRSSRRGYVNGREIELSKTEFDLLALFLSEPDRAFNRNELLDRVWGEWYSDDHLVDVMIARVRRKLAEAGAGELIETLRGVGYRLAAG